MTKTIEAKSQFLDALAQGTAAALWEELGPLIHSNGSWEAAQPEIQQLLTSFEPGSAWFSAAALNHLVDDNIPVEGINREDLLRLRVEVGRAWNAIRGQKV